MLQAGSPTTAERGSAEAPAKACMSLKASGRALRTGSRAVVLAATGNATATVAAAMPVAAIRANNERLFIDLILLSDWAVCH